MNTSGFEIVAGSRVRGDEGWPPLSGFIVSGYAPLVYAAASQCLGDPASEHMLAGKGARAGIVLGSGRFDTESLELSAEQVERGRVSPILFYQVMPTAVLGRIAQDYGLSGPVSCLATGDDARAEALELAELLVSDGSTDWVLSLAVRTAADPRRSVASADLVRAAGGATSKDSRRQAVVRGSWLVDATAFAVRHPTVFELHDRQWDLLPGVFAPTHCVSTGFFAEALPFPRGGTFLEVGCGTGVASVLAAAAGSARVLATDISAAAVANTELNVARHGVTDRVEVRRADLFDGIAPDEKFDLIFWNSPFVLPGAGGTRGGDPIREQLRQAVFDPGYQAHRRFLAGAADHLTPTGRLFLGFSDLGDDVALRDLAARAARRVVTTRTSGELVAGVEYQLLELVPEND